MSSEKKLLTFEDISEREGHVICDSSIVSPPNSDWYYEGVYRARNFEGIILETVEKETEYLKYFIEFLQNPNIFIARGVSLELQRERDMVANNIKYLTGIEKLEKNLRRNHRGENKKNILQEAHDLLHDLYINTKRVSFSPKQKQKYDALERIVMDITEQTGAKIDLDGTYEQRAKPKNLEDFHADEQVVAAALYLSIFENRNGCILTRDSDIGRILGNTISYFFYSENEQFNRLWGITKRNGIRIYFVSGSHSAGLSFDSSDFLPSSKTKEVIGAIDREIQKNPEWVF